MRNMWNCAHAMRTGLVLVTATVLTLPGSADAQTESYLDFDRLSGELRSLTGGSNAARLVSIGTSIQGREIWLVEIGNPSGTPLEERPAVLVVGNLEGSQLVGSSHAVEIVRYLLDGASDAEARAKIQTILDEQTVYVVPRLNPDGAEAMFGSILWGRNTNARPKDDDNDGRTDEDPGEDLNGDGVITVMRVLDSSGDYMIHPDEPRLMKKADPAKGESGEYTLYWEGTDTDGDGFYNEDGPGGVDLNRNFQHEYPYYTADAGPHMVSELETRALMDFVIAHRNIEAILAFGLSDNLVTPPDSRGSLAGAATLDLMTFADASFDEIFTTGVFQSAGGFGFGGFGGGFFFGGGGGSGFRGAQPGRDNDPDSGRRPSTTVHNEDQEYFKTVSEAYKSITGIEKVGVNRKAEGAFFQFGYFQFGIPSFSTQGWALPSGDPSEDDAEEDAGEDQDAGAAQAGARPQEAPEGALARRPGRATGARPGGAGGQARGGAGGGGAAGAGIDAALLKGMDDAGIDAFVDWGTFSHPTLGEVEIGGFHPYAATNPPAEELAELGQKHGEFVVRLAGMLPKVTIVDTEVTAHGGGIFTVEVELENSGYLPTSLQHGIVSRSVQPTMVQIQVDPDDVITGDAKTSMIPKLDGSGSRQSFLWVIRGSPGSTVEIRARSQKGGTDTATVTLR